MAAQSQVVVYRTTHCPFCVAADQMLRARGIEFEEVSLDREPDRRGFTSRILPGHTTVPLVVIDGKPIGGFQELQALEESGALDGLTKS